MTLFFTSDQIEIYRQRRITGTNRFAMSATFTVYAADIQPASDQRTQFAQGRIGAVFTAFIDATVGAKEGDYLVVTDSGKKYAVKGVKTWQGAGLLDHTELLLVAQDG